MYIPFLKEMFTVSWYRGSVKGNLHPVGPFSNPSLILTSQLSTISDPGGEAPEDQIPGGNAMPPVWASTLQQMFVSRIVSPLKLLQYCVQFAEVTHCKPKIPILVFSFYSFGSLICTLQWKCSSVLVLLFLNRLCHKITGWQIQKKPHVVQDPMLLPPLSRISVLGGSIADDFPLS